MSWTGPHKVKLFVKVMPICPAFDRYCNHTSMSCYVDMLTYPDMAEVYIYIYISCSHEVMHV